MNANMLLNKIIEKGLSINETLEICDKLCEPGNISIGEALWIKDILGLSNREAVEIFLT